MARGLLDLPGWRRGTSPIAGRSAQAANYLGRQAFTGRYLATLTTLARGQIKQCAGTGRVAQGLIRRFGATRNNE